ncbi:radical SAM family heme chaperone HemW [Nitrospira moscoviensis]|uniref:Heme chaperone HemW n=1 Tax=Nitrospira moscoviensis TaxID=42253 RepID=A0A0K2GCV7_NITMO|nr:radical SAM family heme chaperone HemW [Nitrospira moscoviensis]ALA58796.1 putative Oxygen-independent coproporphyrinogen III oxidase [Nitrospira moscoviensis]
MTAPRDIGLYVHVPFCRQRCHFCAFYLEVARPERIDAFCRALAREIHLYREADPLAGRNLISIYFGGGTPTAMPALKLIALLDLVRAAWPVGPSAEITVEAHPATVTRDDLHMLADASVTRVSFGAESMQQDEFGKIGRPGTVRETEAAVADAKAAGIANINLDLMYGLPGQTVDSWAKTLDAARSLDPAHLSCYALTIEEGTRLAHDIGRDLVAAPDESQQVEMEAAAEEMLTAAGFRRYEISNYAKPGWECRHNLLYWTGQDYLGLGPSAQSYVNGVRFGDIADLTAYVECLRNGRLPVAERTELSPAQQQRDALVFGLRLIEGVPQERVDTALATPQSQAALAGLVASGLMESEAGRLKLTRLGQRYADTVAGDLF